MNKLALMQSFVTIVRQGSLTAAATYLGTSRSLLSKHVAQIEGHLEAKVLNRDTRSLSLTSAGQMYFEFAERILEEISRAEASFRSREHLQEGTIRLLAAPTFGRLFLASAIADYMAAFPNVNILTILIGQRLHSSQIVNQSYDLAVSTIRPRDSNLVIRRIAPIDNVVCATPEYFEKFGMPRTPPDLLAHRCFYHRNTRDYRWVFYAKGSNAGIDVPLPRLPQTNNLDMLKYLTQRGMGIGLIPEFCVFREIADGSLVRALPDYRTKESALHVLYARSGYVPPRVRAFIRFLCNRFAAPPWRQGGHDGDLVGARLLQRQS
jgi:DNA-binding transcriptional LysR family regulator